MRGILLLEDRLYWTHYAQLSCDNRRFTRLHTSQNTGNPPRFARSSEVGLSGHGQPLHWCDAAQGHLWAFMIVIPHPLSGVKLDFF
jgi:hypothetical protein